MAPESWQITNNRFVALFDILGFKDLVLKNSHAGILQKLHRLKEVLHVLDDVKEFKQFEPYQIAPDQTKSVTFSDTIIFFSKGDTRQDLIKILSDSLGILHFALKDGLAIKGALSYGEITVDFEQSLFFGQPIIDA